MELAVIGESEFTLGFRLAGIRKVIEVKDAEKDVKKMMEEANVGIVIMDEKTLDELDENIKEDVTNSIKPVFVVISEQQEELRKMIIKSIGVDLLGGQ